MLRKIKAEKRIIKMLKAALDTKDIYKIEKELKEFYTRKGVLHDEYEELFRSYLIDCDDGEFYVKLTESEKITYKEMILKSLDFAVYVFKKKLEILKNEVKKLFKKEEE